MYLKSILGCVTETVKRWKRSGSSVGIILPTKAMVAEYKNMLSEYAPVVINRELKSFTTKEGLFISHYHAIKGLEFDRIIMPACVSDSFMSTADMQEIESEEERKKHLATLIYTACTRAKERLLITGVGKLVEQLPLYNGLCKANFPLDNSTNQKAAIQVEDKISERIVEDTVFPVATNTKVKITEVSDKPTPQPPKPSLKVKQKVAHIKYGEGIVEEVRGNYISISFGKEKKKFVYPDCVDSGFISVVESSPKLKVGDRVRPTRMIPVLNKKNMFEDETGVIVGIKVIEYEDCWFDNPPEEYSYTVKRDRDGEMFEGHERLWEKA